MAKKNLNPVHNSILTRGLFLFILPQVLGCIFSSGQVPLPTSTAGATSTTALNPLNTRNPASSPTQPSVQTAHNVPAILFIPKPTPSPPYIPTPPKSSPFPVNNPNRPSPMPSAIPTPSIPQSPTPTPSAAPITPISSGAFVIRKGSQLYYNQNPFFITGPNIYWLGYDENVGQAYPSRQRIAEALAIAQAMGATVVRSHSLGVSSGNSNSLYQGPGKYNDQAFNTIDYAIYQARAHNIKLLIPFTDDYHYYHGGKLDFVYARGLDGNDTFYSNSTVVNDFKGYINHLLTHVNPLTGVAYKDDPAILAWETGNELGTHAPEYGSAPPTSWSKDIAQYVKSIDPNHLMANGREGLSGDDLNIQEMDLYTKHYYGINVLDDLDSSATVARQAGKVFYVGEYGANTGDLNSFLTKIERTQMGGDLWWSLIAHNDNCSGWVTHTDGFTFDYGMDSGQNGLFLSIINHALRLMGKSTLGSIPNVPCNQ